MRIAQTSDTHLGITKEAALRRMLNDLKKEEFDILVHCGDYSGGTIGHRTLRATVRLIREAFPEKPFVSVCGNHDLWSNPRGLEHFRTNYDAIVSCFKEHGVHFLDEDGPYIHPAFPNHTFIGHTGWYSNPHPPTNDENFLPTGLEGDTNRYLLRKAEDTLVAQTGLIGTGWRDGVDTLIFVSHFPVVNTGPDYKGPFELYSWNANISKWLAEDFGCRHFLCGHAHQRHEGPLRWEAGSDYYKPRYQIIEV